LPPAPLICNILQQQTGGQGPFIQGYARTNSSDFPPGPAPR
jgi:hypothetical protein